MEREIASLVSRLRAAFDQGLTRPLQWRRRQLDGMVRLLTEQEETILDALAADLGKPRVEAFAAEVAFCLGEVKLLRKNLARWTSAQKVSTPLLTLPGKSTVLREPLGVVLVISPWNYPFQLAISPVCGALAAGNTVLLKPSEVSDNTSAVLAELLPRYLDPDAVAVLQGGVPETTAVLAQRFDHIFFTGSTQVGRIVMRAAAEHLTPVTLELGGKSPTLVDATAKLDTAAKRIVWGKFYNAGQTCVAPDYVLAHRAVHDALLERMAAALKTFYGDDPARSPDFARIINTQHHRRLMAMMDSGRAVTGGQGDEAERYIAPTILADVSEDSPVMADEIFGPILPVLSVDDMDEAIAFVNARPKPLALYLFARDKVTRREVLQRTSSGGVTINHTWLHLAVPELPFGGVGDSGMGAYHGRRTLDTFQHQKAVLTKPASLDPPGLFPPYTDFTYKMVKTLL